MTAETPNDDVSRWLAQAGQRGSSYWEPTTSLFQNYKAWCAEHDSNRVGVQKFCRTLKTNLVRRRLKAGRGFAGLRLRAANEEKR